MSYRFALTFLLWAILVQITLTGYAADPVLLLTTEGQARVRSVYIPADEPADSPVRYCAADLVEALGAMSGATVALVEWPVADALPTEPLVALGELAVKAGAAPQHTSLWQDSWRTVVTADRLLVGGESATAVNDGVMALLHELGVRYLLPRNLPGDPGTVFPALPTVTLTGRDVEAHPFVRSRRLWGHNMGQKDPNNRFSLGWVRRNGGVSAVSLETSHAWSHLIPKDAQQPEYYAIKRYDAEGKPVRGGQFCVSNPAVATIAAAHVTAVFDENPTRLSQSLSPNDGGGACICLDCQRLDVADYLEPSSGKPVLSDRYIHFYNAVAAAVGETYKDRLLPFFVYSEYSRPPRRETALDPMLVPVFAPIRYPRMQGLTNPHSEQNLRLRKEMEAYAGMARQIGYYGYNYNLAETTVPFSKVSIYSEDLPWMASLNMVYMSMETIGNWNSNAPHIYLSARYPLTGEAPAAIMDDYYRALAGAAAPQVRAYWEDVDAAFRDADVHSGSYFGIDRIVTPQRLARWDALLAAAAAATQTDRERQVVALFQSGVQQARLLLAVIRHLNALDIPAAVDARDAFQAFSAELEKEKVTSIYPNRYFSWFIDHVVEDAASVLASGGKVIQTLPNTWGYRADFYDAGMAEEWYRTTNPAARWTPVTTWGGPSLYEQGQGDWKGYQWFRVTFDAPADVTDLMLWFGGNDGATRVWINGQPAPIPITAIDKKTKERSLTWAAEHTRGWRAFSLPVASFLKAGEPTTVTIRINHSLNELNLGGILRPVMLYRAGETPPTPTADTYRRIDM